MILALFVFIFCRDVHAAEPKLEPLYKAQIEKAYTLSQNKSRDKAVELLVSSLKKEDHKSVAFAEESKALVNITNLFLLDKTQQLYELGLSLFLNDPRAAEAKFLEAQKLEPENIQITKAISAVKLSLNDCGLALEQANRALALNPWDNEAEVLLAKSYLCLGKTEKYLILRAGLDPRVALQTPYWITIDSQVQYQAEHFEKAKELADSVIKLDPDYPSAYFWSWKSAMALKQKPGPALDSLLEKYNTLCENRTAKLSRKYLVDPLICGGAAEIAEIQKKHLKSL